MKTKAFKQESYYYVAWVGRVGDPFQVVDAQTNYVCCEFSTYNMTVNQAFDAASKECAFRNRVIQ